MPNVDPVLKRYVLFQIPGWILSCAILLVLHELYEIEWWMAGLLLGLLLIKDVIFFPFLRKSYERNAKTGISSLIGERGVAKKDLAPVGYVDVAGELWKARTQEEGVTIEANAPVVVEGGDGLELVVRRADIRAGTRDGRPGSHPDTA